MNRKEITKFLEHVLINSKLTGMGKHWSKEVSIDYGTSKERRVDFMQFEPARSTTADGIEKGIFTCYELKSCKADVYSGNGLNFIGEKNYIVTTMECWKDIMKDFRNGTFCKYLHEHFPESSPYYGVMVPVPYHIELTDEFESPTPIDAEHIVWDMKVVLPCRIGPRNRSMTELLFFMLRSGK